MKKIIFIITSFIFISCGVDHADFSGKWVEKKQENEMVTISKNGKNYLVEIEDKKFPAQVKDELLEISTQIPVKATIDDNDHLIIAGDEYIRIENSKKRKFMGNWKVKNHDSSKPSECYFLTFDLNIDIDENNKLEIYGGQIENKILNPNEQLNIKNINFDDGKISGGYRFRVELGDEWDGPPILVNRIYYDAYTFHKDFIISMINEDTLLLEYIDRNNTCSQITLIRV